MLAGIAVCAGQSVGPARGALVIAGGGKLGAEILNRFMELAGGRESSVVVIPTAQEDGAIRSGWLEKSPPAGVGMRNPRGLHTRDRAVAESEEFVAPLRQARGVWFEGGRQWRLVDSYLGTRTEHCWRAAV